MESVGKDSHCPARPPPLRIQWWGALGWRPHWKLGRPHGVCWRASWAWTGPVRGQYPATTRSSLLPWGRWHAVHRPGCASAYQRICCRRASMPPLLRHWKWTGPLRRHRGSLDFPFLLNQQLSGATCPCSLIFLRSSPWHGTNRCPSAPRYPAMDSFWTWMGLKKLVWSTIHLWRSPWQNIWPQPRTIVSAAPPRSHPSTEGSPCPSWRRFTGHRQARPVHWAPSPCFRCIKLCVWRNSGHVPPNSPPSCYGLHPLSVPLCSTLPGRRDGFHSGGAEAPVADSLTFWTGTELSIWTNQCRLMVCLVSR